MSKKDLVVVNQRYGNLVVIQTGLTGKRSYNALCRCDCGNEKDANIYHLLDGNIKSCGCYTEATKEKMRQAKLKNPTNYWLGKKRPEVLSWLTPIEKGQRLSIATEFKKGDMPFNYKGDLVGYGNLHKWVGRHLGKPDRCDFCGAEGLSGKEIHWANKSHEYKRELSDWIRLCAPCHGEYDSGRSDIQKYYMYKNGRYDERRVLI